MWPKNGHPGSSLRSGTMNRTLDTKENKHRCAQVNVVCAVCNRIGGRVIKTWGLKIFAGEGGICRTSMKLLYWA